MTGGDAVQAFCIDCGAKLEPEFRFCGSCGRPVDAARGRAATPASEPAPPAASRGRMTVVDDMSERVARARQAPSGDTPVREQPAPREHRETPPAPPPPVQPVAPVHQAYAAPPVHAYAPPPAPYGPPLAYAAPLVVAPATSTNGFAIASLVLGIIWLYGLGSLLAVIFGAVAISQIRRSGGRQTGEGMAIAGLVLGIIGLVLLLTLIIVGISVA
jgi:hypothetical protein